ncbi:hypothetical protein FHW67_000939 [Herbaspirillum sp. Sphag1AN]|uniref:SphA family protein n=1 Tax=unclassified Herbaspirillum TaxID=2624150 RepID=UPI001616F497|nr:MULTISPECIES: transporter [unclassified Herbaspirillum]MBB3211691.1 hypothetical protein [Herbaspirillum sp. Sphag1AN]MBB3245041.1 hypothetical protein [Herbaspirillum sp. Sphag64]
MKHAFGRAVAGTVAATLAATFAPAVQATEGGGSVVPVGVQTIMTGVLQEPGDYLLTYNEWIKSYKITDSKGNNALPGASLSVAVHALRYLHVFDDIHILGGTPAFETSSSYVESSLSSLYGSSSAKGGGDLEVGGSIGWHGQNYHQMVSLLTISPTGAYDANRSVNIGRNYYALQLDYAMTWFFAPDWELSALAKLVYNAKNNATNYRSGVEFESDYALNYHIGPQWFAGLGGYLHNQLTDDTKNGVSYNGGNRVRELVIGPQFGWGTEKYGAYAAWQRQVVARNAAKGDVIFINGFYKF